jgi:hypothetical protein
MFKHVELMRKIAFRIMAKTFGARKKDTGESIYDAYPLTRLVDLLCFEDMDEARAACKHYNITVKKVNTSSSSDPSRSGEVEIIFWRKTDFQEPKHPEKGSILPLHPRKMVRTIERKLHGATRLGVCRGEVSGDGAALTRRRTSTVSDGPISPRPVALSRSTPAAFGFDVPIPPVALSRSSAGTVPPMALSRSPTVAAGAGLPGDLKQQDYAAQQHCEAEANAKAKALLMKQKFEIARLEAQEMKKEEEERRVMAEQEKEEAGRRKLEQKRLQEEQMKQEIEQKRQAELELKERELELRIQRKLEEEERLRREEESRIAEEKRHQREAEEERVRFEKEAARKKAEQAEHARKQEEERHEKERQRLRAEQERRMKEEQERMRREDEAARRELLRRQEEERRRKEADERRKAKEWQDRVDTARKILVWRRWRQRVARQMEMTQGAKASLLQIDPTFSKHVSPMGALLHQAMSKSCMLEEQTPINRLDVRCIIERLLQNSFNPINLAQLGIAEMESSSKSLLGNKRVAAEKTTLLLKVAVILPEGKSTKDESMIELVGKWIHSRLEFGKIAIDSTAEGTAPLYEVRSVVVLSNSRKPCSDCDVALFVIPPPWSTQDQLLDGLDTASFEIDDDVPRTVMVLSENYDDSTYFQSMNQLVAARFGGSMGKLSIIYASNLSEEAFESALLSASKAIVQIFMQEASVSIDRITLSRLCAIVICDAMWRDNIIENIHDGKAVLTLARTALMTFASVLDKIGAENKDEWSNWPPRDFASDNSINNFFSDKDDFPLNWSDCLSREKVEQGIAELSSSLNGSFREVVDRLLARAPLHIREECDSILGNRQFRRCLERALGWKVELQTSSRKDKYVYLPKSMLEVVVQKTSEALLADRVISTGFEATSENIGNNYNVIEIVSDSDYEKSETDADTQFIEGEIQEKMYKSPAPKTEGLETKSNKRSRDGDNDCCFLGSEFDEETEELLMIDKKQRHSTEFPSVVSENQKESSAFTKKLEALLNGDTIDLQIGKTSLSNLLRNVPKIEFHS